MHNICGEHNITAATVDYTDFMGNDNSQNITFLYHLTRAAKLFFTSFYSPFSEPYIDFYGIQRCKNLQL